MKRSRTKKFDAFFEKLGCIVVKQRVATLLFTMAVTLFLGVQLPDMQWDTSTEGYLSPDDPTITQYHRYQSMFGSDDVILLGIKTDNVYTKPFLVKLQALHEELAITVPHMAAIFSLANASSAVKAGETLHLAKILEGFPEKTVDLRQLRNTVRANPLLHNRLVAATDNYATIIVKIAAKCEDSTTSIDQALACFNDPAQSSSMTEAAPLSNKENDKVVAAVQKTVTKYTDDTFDVAVTGTPLLKQVLRRSMTEDAALFIQLAALLIGLLLWAIFRRFAGVVIPMLVVSSSVISTVGLMVLCGKAFKAPTIILPSFLMAMGVGASIHLMTMFYHNLRQGRTKDDAITSSLKHSGMPIFLTSLTTGVGLISFAGAEVAPVADLGLFAAIGVMLSFCYTILLVPSLLTFLPIATNTSGFGEKSYTNQNKLLAVVALFSVNRPRVILFFSGLLLIVAVTGIPKIHFSHDPLAWLPKELPLRQATETIQESLGGVIAVEVLIDSHEEDGIYDPLFLSRLQEAGEKMTDFSEAGIKVAQVSTVTDLLSDVHTALLPAKEDDVLLPQTRDLAAQELLLLENAIPEQLFELVDGNFQLARLTLLAPWRDAVAYVPFLSKLQQEIETTMANSGSVSVTGLIPLLARTLGAAMHSAAKSYILAGCIISLLIVFIMNNIKLGLISLVPNILPIVAILGIIGWLAIPLDIYTMLSGSIAIGLVVDDTIHFMYNFQRYQHKGMTTERAVQQSLQTTGRAILITSIILASGAFICTLSSMNNLFNFGLLTGMTILLAMAADFFLAPAILSTVYGNNTTIQAKPHSNA